MARILLDTCVWGGAVATLTKFGHDVIWCGTWERDPGDTQILEFALTEGRILVTLDKDFGELAIVKGMRHRGIIRLNGFRSKEMSTAIHQLVTAYFSDLEGAAIITANPEHVRIRGGA